MKLIDIGKAIILAVSAYFLMIEVPPIVPFYAKAGAFGVETYVLGKSG